MKNSVVILLAVLRFGIAAISGDDWEMLDYRQHDCVRPCEEAKSCGGREGTGLLCWHPVEPKTCEYNFTLEWYQTMSKACFNCPFSSSDCRRRYCVSADGFPRPLQTVNRRLPGPSIQVCYNDRILVRVKNKLFETGEVTSIHWHGIWQAKGQYMDGVPMLTQCPIQPGDTFTYDFAATTSGTHFWHSHVGMQRGDGIFGSLVVREPKSQDPHFGQGIYDRDLPEHVFIVHDWLHMLTIQKYLSNHHVKNDRDPRGMLISGLGQGVEVQDPDSNEKAFTPRAKFNVTAGFRYRFRVIGNNILNCPIQISVDDHDLLIIASDGRPLTPYPTKSLVLFAGERYDFVLNANQTVGNYWFRAGGLGECAGTNISQTAIIHYSSANDENPPGPTDYDSMFQPGKIVNPFNKPDVASNDLKVPVSDLRALAENSPDLALRQTPDYKFWFGLDFNKVDNTLPQIFANRTAKSGTTWPQISNITNVLPSSPLLSQSGDIDEASFCPKEMLDDTIRYCAGQYCSCIHRYKVKLNSVVEIILVDEGVTYDTSHPMHLHGFSFRVVAVGKMDEKANQMFIEDLKTLERAGKLFRNFENPPIKDVTMVPDGGYTIIRFYADNPGVWFFHCHLQFHSELGMAVVFVVGEPSDVPVPMPQDFPKCGNFKAQPRVGETVGGAERRVTVGWTMILALCSLMAEIIG